ncbi:MAG TPA: hypothetical protein VEF89_11220 [Solirubrobacteraceae bacterium]|nr:hypothetical protein [Solirubrobacteraceae bacterium]
MKTTQQILDSIDNRLRELNREIATLDAARSALGNNHESGPSPRGRVSAPTETPKTVRRTARRNTRRATDVVPAGRLELLLSENGGLTTSALADRTNGNRDQVLTLLRELEAAGKIRRSGQRRGTRWHAITDEDRIRERAAELARRSRRKAA